MSPGDTREFCTKFGTRALKKSEQNDQPHSPLATSTLTLWSQRSIIQIDRIQTSIIYSTSDFSLEVKTKTTDSKTLTFAVETRSSMVAAEDVWFHRYKNTVVNILKIIEVCR